MHKVIINSTPLIALSHINKLNLLKMLYNQVYIPQAVFDEISVKEDSICKIQVEQSLDWIKVLKIKNTMAKEFFKAQLHDGEVEVMILAKEICANLVVIDDKNAKKHAKYLGLNVTGTLGILLKAKQQGFIQEIKPLLMELRDKGIYISDNIINICLKAANEK